MPDVKAQQMIAPETGRLIFVANGPASLLQFLVFNTGILAILLSISITGHVSWETGHLTMSGHQRLSVSVFPIILCIGFKSLSSQYMLASIPFPSAGIGCSAGMTLWKTISRHIKIYLPNKDRRSAYYPLTLNLDEFLPQQADGSSLLCD